MRRFLLGLGLATCLMLGYIQQRVAVVTLGYQRENLQKSQEVLLDQQRVLEYNVLILKSPVILNRRLSKALVELTPPHQVEVVAAEGKFAPVVSPGQEALELKSPWFKTLRRVAAGWWERGPQAAAEPAQGER